LRIPESNEAGRFCLEIYHFPRTSSPILEARREGLRNVFLCRVGVAPEGLNEATGFFLERVGERTYSQEAAAAVMQKIAIPGGLKRFTRKAKFRMLEEGETIRTAEWVGVELKTITGERGKTGALASLSMSGNAERGRETLSLGHGQVRRFCGASSIPLGYRIGN
jgi:hypothetical protein